MAHGLTTTRRPSHHLSFASKAVMALCLAGLHACVAREWTDRLQGGRASRMPPRLTVVYLHEMAPQPTAAAAPAREVPAAAQLAARTPRERAHAMQAKASSPTPPPDGPPEAVPEAEPDTRALAFGSSQTAQDPANPQANTPTLPSDAPAFDWPASTRLSYVLTGHERGELHGTAQVEWIRVGTRYQVHLDVTVGPGFAPMHARRMSSQGEITADGLAPLRYDEENRALFGAGRHRGVRFEPDAVVLATGQRVPLAAGAQDAASQFVQMTYLLGTRAELRTPGAALELPLALPHHAGRWVYDVGATETLWTPFGALDAVPLTPRPPAGRGDALTVQVWLAPSLRFLPVRIRIARDDEAHIDLMLSRRPEVAAP